jgi:hypothetical protein
VQKNAHVDEDELLVKEAPSIKSNKLIVFFSIVYAFALHISVICESLERLPCHNEKLVI